LETNDFANAAEKLERWVEVEPNSADPHMMLAQIHNRAGNREAAVREAQKGVDLEQDPAKKSQYQKLVDVLLGTQNTIITYRNAGSQTPDSADDSDGGIADLEKRLASVKDGDEKDSLLLMLAVAHFDARNWDKARYYVSMVLAKDPEQVTAKAIMESLQKQNK
jgi:Tfp pilus assembly protein PilF